MPPDKKYEGSIRASQTIIYTAGNMGFMEWILGSTRRADGIQVLWKEGKAIKSTVFSFDTIIAMQVNALDLLEKPLDYQIDAKSNRIKATKFCIFSMDG